MKIKTLVAAGLILGALPFTQAVAQTNGHNFQSRTNEQAIGSNYSPHELAAIERENSGLRAMLPENQMIAGTVISISPVIVTTNTSSLFKLLGSIPASLAGRDTALDQIRAMKVTAKTAQGHTVVYFLSEVEARGMSPGSSILFGNVRGGITTELVSGRQQEIFVNQDDPDTQRLHRDEISETRQAGRVNMTAEGFTRASEVQQDMVERVRLGIRSGALTLTTGQLAEMSERGLTPDLASRILTRPTKTAQRTVTVSPSMD